MPLANFQNCILSEYVFRGNYRNKTSQEIVDDLRDMCHLSVNEVSEYMCEQKKSVEFVEGRLVWVDIGSNE